jgi:putative membrane protein
MSGKRWLQELPGALLALAVISSGCRDRSRPAGDTGAVGSASDTAAIGRAPGADTAAPATTKLTDANIVALLDEANAADSSAGAMAVTKAASPEVKRFARLMMSEHHALRLKGQQLAKKLQITPSPPADDPVAPMAQQETSTLDSTAKGAPFDRAYIDQEVAAHQAVKDLLEKSKAAAENDQLKDLIGKAEPVIQKHLDEAQRLQKKLSASA